MAVRQINEYLTSGEVLDLHIASNIKYDAVADPVYKNMFLRIGDEGWTSLYRAPDQDIIWRDTNSLSVPIGIITTEILGVTITEDIGPTDSTYMVSGSLSNTRNQTRIVTLEMRVNGTPDGSQDIILGASELNKTFVLSNVIANTHLSGSVITVWMSTTADGDVTLNGDLQVTVLEITKAQAAPVVAITAQDVQDHDYKLNLTTTTNLGPKLSRTEIETVIVASGYPLPTDTVSFNISDLIRDFAVTYNVTEDRYVYIVTEKAL